jgi:hypothetical protein
VKLNLDEITDARQALEEHTAALKPSNNLAASAAANDYMRHPQRWLTQPKYTIGQMRAIRHEEIRRGRTLSEAEKAEVVRNVQ